MSRYIIAGKHMNEQGISFEGYYVNEVLPYLYIPQLNNKMDITSIIVFDDINDANAYLSYLRKTFEKEFKTKAKDLKVLKSEFSLWLKKLESSTTSITLTDDRTRMLTNKYKSLYPSAKYFGFTTKKYKKTIDKIKVI